MPSDPVIDIDALLVPIEGDNPAGGPVPYAVRQQLEERRKEIDPADFDESDPTRPETVQRADWPGIIELASATLRERSKDLLVAARLAEATTRQHGFHGLRDALRLLRRMVGECWDRLNPAIESDDDLEVRAAPFLWLDEPDRGARFPITVRLTPLLSADGVACSWQRWREAQGAAGGAASADFEKVVAAAPLERCQALAEDLDACAAELRTLADDLHAKMGETYAPSLSGLRNAIEDCRALAQQIVRRKGGAVVDGDGAAGDGQAEASPTAAGGGNVARQVATRADAYRQLAAAADVLARLEPHSPIPYLVRRAVELGAMDFPSLMRALIRDRDVIGSMNRELGIKDEDDD
jgi:type VI secretion system protein ImpA